MTIAARLLGSVRVTPAIKDTSFESGDTQEVIDTGIADIPLDRDNEVSDLTDQITHDAAATESLHNLSRDIHTLHSDVQAISPHQGLSEEQSRLYQVSVESLLISYGLTDLASPSDFVSMESGLQWKDYSTEAEEKTQTVLQRFWEWLKKLWQRLAKLFTSLKDKVFKAEEAAEEHAKTLLGKVTALKSANAKLKDTGPVSLDKKHWPYLCDSGGFEKNPYNLVKESSDLVKSGSSWNTLIKRFTTARSAQAYKTMADDVLKAAHEVKIAPNLEIKVTEGSFSFEALTTISGDEFGNKITPCDLTQAEQALNFIINDKSYDQAWEEAQKAVESVANSISGSGDAQDLDQGAKDAIQKASKLLTGAQTRIAKERVAVLQAVVNYINATVKAYGEVKEKKSEDKPKDKPDETPKEDDKA